MLVENNVALQPYNSFGIAARAQQLVRVRHSADVAALLAAPEWAATPRFVLGGGSNLVITGDIKALVLKVEIAGRRLVEETPKGWLVEAGAGENWHDFVAWTLTQGWPGLENLALIPGTVGASPIQNIGAYGVQVGEFIQAVEAWDRQVGEWVRLDNEQCAFGYRDSVFKQQPDRYLITAVELRLPLLHELRMDYAGIAEELQAQGVETPSAVDVEKVGERKQFRT